MILRKILTTLVILTLSLHAKAQDLPFTINADTFSYSENGDEFIAEGEVYVFSENESLKADKLIYNKKQDKIYAVGNVIMLDPGLNTTYSDKLELSGDFKQGVAKRVITMFNESTGLLQAKKAVKVSESKMNMFKVDYSSCPLKRNTSRPWHITADKITYNSQKEYIIYRNAVLNIKDIPVMYMPMFYHSTNKDKPVSGFLSPGLASSSTDGFGFKTGFFWAIDQNNDATFRVSYLGKRGTILGAEHRYQGSNFKSKVSVEGLADETKDKHIRGLLKAKGEYTFEEGERAGFNITAPSDKNYLDDFKSDSSAYTSSTVYAEKADEKTYLGVSSKYFIDMRSGVDDQRLAQPIGRLQGEKLLDIDDNGGQFKFSTDILGLMRQSGQDTNRVVAKTEYLKPIYSPDGSLFEFQASLRGDYYSFNKDEPNSTTETESRFLPEASISWEKPFMSNDFTHLITPKLMFVTSPERDFADIPNEDSTSFELDASNLFTTNRFSGLDRVETGNRVVYGVDTKFVDNYLLNFHGFLGQSYNFSDKEEDITSDTTSNNKNSDWVGFMNINPNDHLSASTNFRLDSDTFSAQRIDTGVKLSKDSRFIEENPLEKDYVRLTHSYLRDDSEEVNLYGYYNMNEDWALRGRIQHNIYENITLLQEIDTIYKSCCYNLSFKVRKRQSDDEDSEDSLDFLVNFSILPNGRKKN